MIKSWSDFKKMKQPNRCHFTHFQVIIFRFKFKAEGNERWSRKDLHLVLLVFIYNRFSIWSVIGARQNDTNVWRRRRQVYSEPTILCSARQLKVEMNATGKVLSINFRRSMLSTIIECEFYELNRFVLIYCILICLG